MTQIHRIGFLILSVLILGGSCIARAQDISLSPAKITFPNQAIGTSSSASSITLWNNQTGSLTISNIQIAAPFSQTNNCGTGLTANQQCTISVTFSPTAKQYYSSTLVVTNSAGNSPQSVLLTGNGVIPVTFSPAQLNFPNQATGTTSNAYPVTMSNNLSAAIAIASIQATAPFAETNNCGTSLASGASCTLSVTFDPTAVQYYSSTLTISSGGSSIPQAFALTGSGVSGIVYTPKLINFPNQPLNSTSASYPITLTNNQASAMAISSIATAAPYAETNNCGTSLGAGLSCTVNVTFSPTTVKYYPGSLTITDNGPASPQTVSLAGNGVIPVKIVPVVGGLYFDHQIATTPSTPEPVTITSNLSTPLTFSSITSSPEFPFTTNCGNGQGGGTLAPGASCTIQISFDPQAVTTYNANLTIAEKVPGSPQLVPLVGTGIAGAQGPMVTVKPPAPCIRPSGTQQFTADVTDMSNTAVNWYVNGKLNGNATVGTISPTGFYTAPSTTNNYTITATSQSSSSVSYTAKVTVSDAPSYEIYPFVASIPEGAQQTFQAQSCNVPQTANISFTVDGIAGGNSTVGTISSAGLYTAPPTPGKHTVRAIDSTLNRSSGGVVTVFSSITADFGSRAKTTAPVPAEMFGYGRGESIPTAAGRNLLSQGGIMVSRMSAQINAVFTTTTPNWTKIDPLVATVQSAGQRAILQMNESPTWLEPTSGSCAGNATAAPTNVTEWAQVAAQYVAHMDATFPGVVQDYEIGNEPNSSGMCSTANHMTTYEAIYAAAAPAMKAQAAQDGVTIRIGGPVLSGYNKTWLSSFLTDPSTAPYVDFVSYHQYFLGASQMQAQWDTYTGDLSLYELTQDPTIGAAGDYGRVVTQVAAGKQPLGANTPIYVTEYNSNWAFFQDCCRSSSTYAPVWNALYVTDMLDTVYNGIAHMPSNLDYFAGSAYPWFCLIGVLDTNMDCLYSVDATPVAYPQYFAYDLIASPQYLGLSAGGYMAKSISTPTGGGGLATTAFFTTNQDAIVITNPTSTPYSAIKVTFANPGLTGTQGTFYQIVNGAQIDTSPISFTVQGTSVSTTISVPAYSVQAVSLP